MNRKHLLSQKGLKITKPRLEILKTLNHATHPLTAEEIYLQCQNKQINLSTIYRTLEKFLHMKIILKPLIKNDSKACYILNHHEHKHYLICEKCHQMIEITNCPFDDYAKSIAEKTNYTITNHKLALFGICPECQKN